MTIIVVLWPSYAKRPRTYSLMRVVALPHLTLKFGPSVAAPSAPNLHFDVGHIFATYVRHALRRCIIKPSSMTWGA